jgi:hypothetical protein
MPNKVLMSRGILTTSDPADAEANVDEANGIKTEDGAENETGVHQV